MKLIARISKGSVMDQIYLPKQRSGLQVGSYVLITPALQEKKTQEPVLYGIKKIEPLKIEIARRIFFLVEKSIECQNIVVTGSFVKRGFGFRDIDVLIVSYEKKANEKELAEQIEQEIGVKSHVLVLTDKELSLGVARDPLYALMISRCVAYKRFTYHVQKRIVDYKLLDINLLGSKVVFYSFDIMPGDDIYYAVRNMVAVDLFLNGKASAEQVEKKIEYIFRFSENEIRRKELNKAGFLKKYKQFYRETFEKILALAHDAKQKKTS